LKFKSFKSQLTGITPFFKNHSQAIQKAVSEKLLRLKRTRLAEGCTRLEPSFERALAGEGLVEDMKEWPEY
jgi:hypothetical protein